MTPELTKIFASFPPFLQDRREVRTATVTSSSPNHNMVIDEVTTGLILSSNRSGPKHRKAQRDCAGAFHIFPSRTEHTWPGIRTYINPHPLDDALTCGARTAIQLT